MRDSQQQIFVGKIVKRGRLTTASSLFSDDPYSFALPKNQSFRSGTIVVAKAATDGGKRGHRGKPRLQEIGDCDVAADVINALMIHGSGRIPRGTKQELKLGPNESADRAARNDLRQLTTVTIDPDDAKDFDDAISAEQLDSGAIRVWVHIADVTSFVHPGSKIDLAAQATTATTYMPGQADHMLPAQLSEQKCSLRPGELKRVLTISFDVAQGGAVANVQVQAAEIQSDARLTYSQAQKVLDGRDELSDLKVNDQIITVETAEQVIETVILAATAAKRLQLARPGGFGGVTLKTFEPRFEFDKYGNVKGIKAHTQGQSNQLIETLMVEANHQIAKITSANGLPAIYRIHGRPSAKSTIELIQKLRALGVVNIAEAKLAKHAPEELFAQIAQGIDSHCVARNVDGYGLTSQLLRAQQKAEYSDKAGEHFGLGLDYYSHFTSPIRRYPDVVTHRSLNSIVEPDLATTRIDMVDMVEQCNLQERRIIGLERLSWKIASAFYAQSKVTEFGWDQTYVGEVSGVSEHGIFVLIDLGFGDRELVEGMLPLRNMGGDFWELDELGVNLVGRSSGDQILLGQMLQVKICGTEPLRGRVTLEVALIWLDLDTLNRWQQPRRKSLVAATMRLTAPPGIDLN